MPTLPDIVHHLDSLLDINGIEDKSPNGLQVEGRSTVNRVGLAVDYSPELVEQATRDGMDLLFVHHGLIWGGLQRITGVTLAFLKPLLTADISLYAAHLPLDIHPELGHNACLARMLQLQSPQPFGRYHGREIGLIGQLPAPQSRDSLVQVIRRDISPDLILLPFGPSTISRVAVVSGGGASLALEAREAGADFFLTGETSHSVYHQIKAAGLNVGFAGHYISEKWGVLAVANHLESHFDLETRFYDIPTPF